MTTLHADVRPFQPVVAIDRFVEAIRLVIGEASVSADSWVAMDEDFFLRGRVTLQLANNADVLADHLRSIESDLVGSPYSKDDLALVVVLTSSFLKQAEVDRIIPLNELSSFGHELNLGGPPRPRPLSSPKAGCEVEVSICLQRELPRKPLQAWRAWTWLSRTSFRVKSERSFTDFRPRPLGDIERSRLGLPKGTLRYVSMGDLSPLDPGTSADSLEIWIDSEVLASMTAARSAPASAMVQRQLFLDCVAAIVMAAREDPGIASSRFEDLDDTLLGFVVRMAGGSGCTSDDLNAYIDLIVTDPAKFLARMEEAIGLASAVGDVVGGKS